MKGTNLSLVNDQAHALKKTHKIGSILFIIGLLVLANGFFFEFFMTQKIAAIFAFAFMLIGAMIFTYHPKTAWKFYTNYFKVLNKIQIFGLVVSILGLLIIGLNYFAWPNFSSGNYLILSFVFLALGISAYTYGSYAKHTSGIKNNFVFTNSLSSRGLIAWVVGIFLTAFYIQLYWFPETLSGLVSFFNPLALLLTGKNADQWFVYGTFYTFVIVFLGLKFMVKYRHNRYQLIRTSVVIFSQVVFAYFLPQIMEGLHFNNSSDASGAYLGYYSGNPVNSWPLNYDFFTSGHLLAYTQKAYQPIGIAYLVWGILLFLVVTPVLTYYVGKRWYCSWFCGCGGLAETAGDAFRQLSDKSTKAWKIERWVIHSVMVFVLIMTIGILVPFFSGKEFTIGFLSINKTLFFVITSIVLALFAFLFYKMYQKHQHKTLLIASIIIGFVFIFLSIAFFTGSANAFILKSTSIKKAYGFFVGSAFSGVIGVGFYPILGNRVWCRFGCPMAGYMGLFQRFKSRFRITTNGGQCISCGNCSTYCEQGIDVRAYAQKGQDITRASCVGCGICSAVCPRGVLKLENGPITLK